jgi:hypothetical protein
MTGHCTHGLDATWWQGYDRGVRNTREAAPLVSAPDLAGPESEFAWLIERSQPEGQVPTVWLDATTGIGGQALWTTDAWRAARFPTQAEAEAYMAEHSGVLLRQRLIGRAVEHGFVPDRAASPAPSAPDRPWDHPYDAGSDNVCIHCGQIGSYAHTEEAYRKSLPDV